MDTLFLAETEALADQIFSMANAWMLNPAAQTTSVAEDGEFQRLDAARDEIKRRKYSTLQRLPLDTRWALTQRHPMWIMEYDLSTNSVMRAKLSEAFPGDHIGLECELSPEDTRTLRMYYWVGGMVLKVNTPWVQAAQRRHAEDPSVWDVLEIRKLAQRGISLSGEFTRRDAIKDHEHTWLFVGTRWECAGPVLRLDFGRHTDERDLFVTKTRQGDAGESHT